MEKINGSTAPSGDSPVFAPDDYSNIYRYCEEYAKGKSEDETLAVIMDHTFIDAIRELNTQRVAGVFGIHNEKLTISLLALKNGTNTIIDEHKNGTAKGQQVWPQITIRDFKTLLPKPLP